MVYGDVTGFDQHTVRGENYHIFRHYGHNIVVGRILNPNVMTPPANLNVKADLIAASILSSLPGIIGFVGLADARDICNRFWNALPSQSVNTVTLLVVRGGISYSVAANTRAYVHNRNYKFFSTFILATAN